MYEEVDIKMTFGHLNKNTVMVKERQSMSLSFKNKANLNMTIFTNVDSRDRIQQYRIGSD